MKNTNTYVIDGKTVVVQRTFNENGNNVIDVLLKYFNEKSNNEE